LENQILKGRTYQFKRFGLLMRWLRQMNCFNIDIIVNFQEVARLLYRLGFIGAA